MKTSRAALGFALLAAVALLTGVVSVRTGSGGLPNVGTSASTSLVDTTAPASGEQYPELEEALKACAATGLEACISEWAQNAVSEVGVERAAELVSSDQDKLVERICHGVMHDLGRISALEPGAVPTEVIKKGGERCNFGFEHGVLIGVAKSGINQRVFEDQMATICQIFPKEQSAYASCIHGVGHAASVRLPNDPAAASRVCAQLGEGVAWCVSGVVMEWGTAVGRTFLKTQDLDVATKICRDIGTNALGVPGESECAKEMPDIIVDSGRSRVDAARWCLTLEGAEVQNRCAQGIHFTFVTQTSVDIDEVRGVCAQAFDGANEGACVGAARALYANAWITISGGGVDELCSPLEASARVECENVRKTSEQVLNRHPGG